MKSFVVRPQLTLALLALLLSGCRVAGMCVDKQGCEADDGKLSQNRGTSGNGGGFGINSASGDCTGAPFIGDWNMRSGSGRAVKVNFANDCSFTAQDCGLQSEIQVGSASGDQGMPLDFVGTQRNSTGLSVAMPEGCPDLIVGGRDECLFKVEYRFEGRTRVPSRITLDCGALGESILTPISTANPERSNPTGNGNL